MREEKAPHEPLVGSPPINGGEAAPGEPDETFRVPEISVITSWRIPVRADEERTPSPEAEVSKNTDRIDERQPIIDDAILPGLDLALAEGCNLLDLFVLDHHEIKVYAREAGLRDAWLAWNATRDKTDRQFGTPAAFLGQLDEKQLRQIGDYLRRRAAAKFEGRAVGRRPRFAALATYFPQLGSPVALYEGIVNEPNFQDGSVESFGRRFRDNLDEMIRHRDASISALRNALRLARLLGCHCVEAVGGSRIPQPQSYDEESMSADVQYQIQSFVNWAPQEYVDRRIDSLVDGIEQIFRDQDGKLLTEKLPLVALELEPGPSYLLNDVKTFYEVWLRLSEDVQPKVGLNADLAHFFLLGIDTPDKLIIDPYTGNPWTYRLPGGGEREAKVETDLPILKSCIVHMHVSDHAGDFRSGGVHSSDLIPGEFHTAREFAPWLEFACRRPRWKRGGDPEANPPRPDVFSGTIAVELEGGFQASDLLVAKSTFRGWLQDIAQRSRLSESNGNGRLPLAAAPQDLHRGAILVLDLGNSTSEIYDHPSNALVSAAIQSIIGEFCNEVRFEGGSVMSFTGDGVVALFEERLLPGQAAPRALTVALRTARIVREQRKRLRDAMSEQFGSVGPDETAPLTREAQALTAGTGEAATNVDEIGESLTVRAGLHWGECFIPTFGALADQALSRDVVYACRLCSWLGVVLEPAVPRKGDRNIPRARHIIGATSAFHDALLDEARLGRKSGNEYSSKSAAGSRWELWGVPEMKGLKREKKAVYIYRDRLRAQRSS